MPPELRQYGDYARFFLDRMYRQSAIQEVKPGNFTNLKKNYLVGFFPNSKIYYLIRAAMEDSKTIECDDIYYRADGPGWKNTNPAHSGGKAFGYRLGPRWAGARHIQVELKRRALLKSIQAYRDSLLAAPMSKAEQWIWDCLQLLRIDHVGAVTVLDRLDAELDSEPDNDVATASRRELQFQRDLVDGIVSGELEYAAPAFGRVSNTMTRIRKVLRPFLSIVRDETFSASPAMSVHGTVPSPSAQYFHSLRSLENTIPRPESGSQALISLDIKSSHPVILGHLCREHTLRHNTMPGGYRGENQYGGLFAHEGVCLHNRKDGQEHDGIPEDVTRFIHLCEGGGLYEHLLEGIEGKSRDWAKTGLLTAINGKEGQGKKMADRFSAEFPTVWAYLQEVKAKDHRNISHILLKREASIVIGGAIGECARRRIWCLSLHDAVICLPDDADEVDAILRQAFLSEGMRPAIKRTSFADEGLTPEAIVELQARTPTTVPSVPPVAPAASHSVAETIAQPDPVESLEDLQAAYDAGYAGDVVPEWREYLDSIPGDEPRPDYFDDPEIEIEPEFPPNIVQFAEWLCGFLAEEMLVHSIGTQMRNSLYPKHGRNVFDLIPIPPASRVGKLIDAARKAGVLDSPTEDNPNPSIGPLYRARDAIPYLFPDWSVTTFKRSHPRGSSEFWQLEDQGIVF